MLSLMKADPNPKLGGVGLKIDLITSNRNIYKQIIIY